MTVRRFQSQPRGEGGLCLTQGRPFTRVVSVRFYFQRSQRHPPFKLTEGVRTRFAGGVPTRERGPRLDGITGLGATGCPRPVPSLTNSTPTADLHTIWESRQTTSQPPKSSGGFGCRIDSENFCLEALGFPNRPGVARGESVPEASGVAVQSRIWIVSSSTSQHLEAGQPSGGKQTELCDRPTDGLPIPPETAFRSSHFGSEAC